MERTVSKIAMTVSLAALIVASQFRGASAVAGTTDTEIRCSELHAPAPGQSPGGACSPGDAAGTPRQVVDGTLSTEFGEVAATFEVVDGYAIFEGDIIAGPVSEVLGRGEAISHGEGVSHVESRATGRTSQASRWPDGVVPYAIDPALPNQQRVHAAIAHWQAHTAIRFVPRSTERDYVEFQPSDGCSSHLGRIGGRQPINLAANCTTGNTIHEIGHAVGLWHEQSRADRDANVLIHWDNIPPQWAYAFRTYVEQGHDGADYGSFDFGSIMMYGPYLFAIDSSKPTITRRDGTLYQSQRDVLSPGDRAAMRVMYPKAPLRVPTGLTPGTPSLDNAPSVFGEPLRMRWTESGGADFYTVGIWHSDLANGNWVYDGDYDTPTNALDYVPPVSGTYYAWHVTARNGSVSSPVSDFAHVWYAAAPPCAVSVTSSGASLGWRGGTRRASVVNLARCQWTATSDADWITIVSTRPGTKRGNVRFAVARNHTGGFRVGTLTIGDNSFTVTQRPR